MNHHKIKRENNLYYFDDDMKKYDNIIDLILKNEKFKHPFIDDDLKFEILVHNLNKSNYEGGTRRVNFSNFRGRIKKKYKEKDLISKEKKGSTLFDFFKKKN
jgi:hypothetical protein